MGAQLITDIELVGVEQEQNHVGAIRKPVHESFKLVPSAKFLKSIKN